jgi:hypothetical protein
MDIFEYSCADRAIPIRALRPRGRVYLPQSRAARAASCPAPRRRTCSCTTRKAAAAVLVVVPYAKRVDLRALARAVGSSKLRFASAELLLERLGITPGAVSVLALCNDRSNAVDLIVDASTWAADALQLPSAGQYLQPWSSRRGLERFLAATGHTPRRDGRSSPA